jgi:site-specific recombinase XerD
MKPNKAELAVLRGKRDPAALQLWTATFGRGDSEKAERYALAVSTFLGQPPPGAAAEQYDYLGQYSPNTQKAYAYALTEFFEWAAAEHEKVVAPEQITRMDTEKYVNWLANRPFSLSEEKLKDGDKEVALELFEIVKALGSASLQEIIENLSTGLKQKYFNGEKEAENFEMTRRRLSRDVRQLVTMDVLDSDPTWEVLRREHPQAGITLWTVDDTNIDDLFTYTVKEVHSVSRTTIAQRVSALSSFWKVMMQGENREGGEPLLKYNVWDSVKARVSRGLVSLKKEASRRKKMPSDKVIQMLKNVPDKTLVDLRNRALLYLMVFAGVRTTELLRLRRGKPPRGEWKAYFDGSEPPSLQLLRKGNKWQRLPYPPVALKPLIEFQRALEKSAASPELHQKRDRKEAGYIPPDHVSWYYLDLQLPDAPLFPPLDFWGRNSRNDYRKSMSRVQVFRLVKRIATEAGLTPEEVAKVHPHAIRHFAANAMVEGGKDLREVQHILGHSSVTTTESYLEDIDGDVKLSGQEAVLSYLQARGVEVEPTNVGPQKPREREVIDTFAVEVQDPPIEEPSDLSPEVTVAEVEVLNRLEEEPLPAHELPEAPPDYAPEATLMALPGERGTVVETADEGIVGLDAATPSDELLQDLAQTVREGKSPGSPVWVYENMADPRGQHETVIFNRGGEREIEWLKDNYVHMPKNFGVGHESYLPWYVKARGNISRGGYFRGMPPFPVFSPEQCNPETNTGEKFLQRVEETYSRFVHGDTERGVLPSPLRSVGMVRWFSFFVYHSKKLEEEFAQYVVDSVPKWLPFNAVVPLKNLRAHDDSWLVQWLADNAHTYRASVDAMKRGVSRTEEDITASFLKSSFEGIELITEMPDWMIYDDPVRQLYDSNKEQWGEMIEWLKNVTGQKLEATRRVEREEQQEFSEVEQKTKARTIRDLLLAVLKLVDKLEFAKHNNRSQVRELRDQLRMQLYWYATAAGDVRRLRVSLDSLKEMSTKEFNETMDKEYQRLGVPNPNAEPYRSLRGKRKVSAIVTALFPEIPELDSGNIFAESSLFNPRWFRIDEEEKTIYIDPGEREKLWKQFGQDPELLVRRATRAMWTARDKGHEALWGILMSYFSWIVPSGREMESQVLGIPVARLYEGEGDEELNVQARKTWLKTWIGEMKKLATGERVDLQEGDPEPEDDRPAWQKFLEEEGKRGEDALDYLAGDGYDFAASSSISGGYGETPESLLMSMEDEEEDYLRNGPKHRLLANGSGTVVYLKGEQPKKLYKVDLFGRKEGTLRPNAPPKYMSPGAVYRAQKRVFPARQLLPSPFRMIAAMDLPL